MEKQTLGMSSSLLGKENTSKNKIDKIVGTALKGIGIAMGIAVTVLSVLGELEANTAFIMLGIGLASISISMLKDKEEVNK